jgi:hypothetical protein
MKVLQVDTVTALHSEFHAYNMFVEYVHALDNLSYILNNIPELDSIPSDHKDSDYVFLD